MHLPAGGECSGARRSRFVPFVLIALVAVLMAANGCQGSASPHSPAVTKSVETTVQPIPFDTKTQTDKAKYDNFSKVTSPGTPGEEKIEWLVTYSDGVETTRTLRARTVIKRPQAEVLVKGTKSWAAHQAAQRHADLVTQTRTLSRRWADQIPDDWFGSWGTWTVLDGGQAAIQRSSGDMIIRRNTDGTATWKFNRFGERGLLVVTDDSYPRPVLVDEEGNVAYTARLFGYANSSMLEVELEGRRSVTIARSK
jgi:hypothetical protein